VGGFEVSAVFLAVGAAMRSVGLVSVSS